MNNESTEQGEDRRNTKKQNIKNANTPISLAGAVTAKERGMHPLYSYWGLALLRISQYTSKLRREEGRWERRSEGREERRDTGGEGG